MIDTKKSGIIVTNDGWRVMQLSQLTHPATQLIVNAMNHLHHSFGDGSTFALLLCSSLMSECVYWLYGTSVEEMSTSGSTSGSMMTHTSCHESVLCHDLYHVSHVIVHEMLPRLVIVDDYRDCDDKNNQMSLLLNSGDEVNDKKSITGKYETVGEMMELMIRQILGTKHATAKFQAEIGPLLVRVLRCEGYDSLLDMKLSCDNEKKKNEDEKDPVIESDFTRVVQQPLSTTIVKMANSDLTKSSVMPQTTIVIGQYLSSMDHVTTRTKVNKMKKVNICICTFDFQFPRTVSGMKQNITSADAFRTMDQIHEEYYQALVDRFVKHKVQVCFTTDSRTPLRLAQLMSEASIHLVLLPDVMTDKELLSLVRGCQVPRIITHTSILNRSPETTSLCGQVDEFKMVTIRQSLCRFYIKCNQSNNMSIVLKGPTMEFLNEIEIAVVDTLKVCRTVLSGHLPAAFVRGGGCVESQLISMIDSYVKEHLLENTTLGQVFGLFSRSLNVIPKTLIANSLPLYNGIVLQNELNELHNRSSKLREVNPCCKNDNDVIESLLLKQNIIQASVDLVCALLKVDALIVQKSVFEQ